MKKDGQDDIFTYDGMRKAVRRDIADLEKTAGNPERLRRWLNRKKDGKKLQIRITKNQFLLNNILCLLGIRFEDLFNSKNLPGKVDEIENTELLPNKGEDTQETGKLLQEINAKLDEIILKQEGEKPRKNYIQRFTDISTYLLFVKNIVLSSCDEPEKSGFSYVKNGNGKNKRTLQEIYANNFSFLCIAMQNINRKTRLQKLFTGLHNMHDDNFSIGRLISPLFMTGILIHLFINFIKSGNRNRKPIFQIIEGNMPDFFKWGNYDNNKVLEKLEASNERILNLIKHILSCKIIPEENLYIKYEKIFISFFNNTNSLFDKQVPVWHNMFSDFFNIGRKEMENQITKKFTPGYFFSFGIKQEQLEYFDKFGKEMDDAQFDLEDYYVGNVDTAGTSTTGKQITAVRRLPEGSN